MKVLVACEYSGTVRDAFRARGHSAWSCDLLPTDADPTWHIRDDVCHVLSKDPWWDLVIAHPPCTYLSNSGAKHLYAGMKKENGINHERWRLMEEAAEFFRMFLSLPCPVAVENPIMHGHAKQRVGMSQTQTIQPWQFGHGETKATCLWLKGLPPLQPTNIVEGREQRIWKLPPTEDRWKIRSATFPGIAEAMAEQWGSPAQREMAA
jgi:hypothetical protein